MGWSGGSFTRTDGTRTGSDVWAQAKAAAVKIIATDHDTHDQDLADGINACLTKDGSNVMTGNLDVDGNKLILDADGDTSLHASTDDQIDIEIAGADDFTITANSFNILNGSSIVFNATSTLDLNGQKIILDADADTSLHASTDDQIDIEIAGADDFTITANSFNVLGGSSIVFNATSTLDLNGQELILDADADTSIHASTDDQIDIKIATADDFRFTANTFTVLSGSTISVGSGATLNVSSGTLTLADNQISGNKVHGGTISNFASTGINDDATSIAMTIDSSERVGIGVTSPLAKLHVQTGSVSNTPDVNADELCIEGSGNVGMTIYSGATSVGSIYFGDTSADKNGRISYDQNANELQLWAGATEQLAMTSGGIFTPNASGGAQGTGTINADAVYDDGSLLTCYVAEAAIDGDIDEAEWDRVAFGPRHEPARRFRMRQADDLDPDQFWNAFVARKALPAFPTKAEWESQGRLGIGDTVQRLWETSEVLVVHIHNINERLTAVEATIH